MIDVVSAVLAGITTAGVAQSLGGWLAVNRFAQRLPAARSARPPITMLKPLHGDEPLLEAALTTLCRQDFPAWQIVFGVHDERDPAAAVVRRLQQRFPALDMVLVTDSR